MQRPNVPLPYVGIVTVNRANEKEMVEYMNKYDELNTIESRKTLSKTGLDLLVMVDKLRGFAHTLDSLIIYKNISLDDAEKNIDGWEDIHVSLMEFEDEFIMFCECSSEEFTHQSYATFKFEEAKRTFDSIADYLFSDLIPAINKL